MATKTKITLGATVKDTVTGFEGLLTGRAEYLHNNTRLEITGVDGTGRPVEIWCAEASVEEIK